jgi:hypothetical protein
VLVVKVVYGSDAVEQKPSSPANRQGNQKMTRKWQKGSSSRRVTEAIFIQVGNDYD